MPIRRVHPDGAHGSFELVGASPTSRLVDLRPTRGRLLAPDDGDDDVVLNQLAAAATGARVGERVSLVVAGQPLDWRVVGTVEEVGSPARAYVTAHAFTARAAAARRGPGGPWRGRDAHPGVGGGGAARRGPAHRPGRPADAGVRRDGRARGRAGAGADRPGRADGAGGRALRSRRR
ncbi:MAG: hypothetical protein R3F59_23935 [Myxococcota bacterium]